jgi:hypothetical protein
MTVSSLLIDLLVAGIPRNGIILRQEMAAAPALDVETYPCRDTGHGRDLRRLRRQGMARATQPTAQSPL